MTEPGSIAKHDKYKGKHIQAHTTPEPLKRQEKALNSAREQRLPLEHQQDCQSVITEPAGARRQGHNVRTPSVPWGEKQKQKTAHL